MQGSPDSRYLGFGWDVVFTFVPWGQKGHVMFLFEFTYYKGILFVEDFFVCLAEFVLHATVSFLH